MNLRTPAPDARPLLRAPGARLLFIVLAGMALCLLITILALRTPWLGLDLEAREGRPGLLVTQSQGPSVIVAPGSTLLAITEGVRFDLGAAVGLSSRIELQPTDLIEDPGMLTSFTEVRRLMHRQTTIHHMLQGTSVTLEWETPSGALQTSRVLPEPSRPLSALPAIYWIQLASGLLALIIGSWVWVLRPRDWGARMFGLTGATMLTFTLPAAWYSTRELALNGATFSLLSGINMSGAILFGCALIAIFLCFPRQLVSPWKLLWIPVIFGSLLVAELLRLWPLPLGNAITLLQTLVAVSCVVWQWRVNRGDPSARAALRWVGLSALVGAALFVVPQTAAPLLGAAPPVSQGLGFVFFLIMYAGIALGVARYRLFELDEWAYRILLWVTGVILLLLVDAVLIWLLHLTPALSLGLALLLVGFLYLPLRNWFWHRLVARRRIDEDTLFRGVLEVVLEPDERRRARQWQQLLQQLFEPLAMKPSPIEVGEPELRQDGLALLIPATSGAPALELSYPWQGRGLFSRVHLRLARRVLAFLAQADVSRAEFQRGVQEERQRITRDLHDDIGARLISSLHYAQEPQVQRLLRSTLQDLRVIVSGLSGEPLSLTALLDRLREETRERLEAAGIDLEWEAPELLPAVSLPYATYKNIMSAQREIVSNLIRHSGAVLARVTVLTQADALQLNTRDYRSSQVAPMASAAATEAVASSDPGPGMGLRHIASRLAEIHGSVDSQDYDDGRSVTLTLPLNPEGDGTLLPAADHERHLPPLADR